MKVASQVSLPLSCTEFDAEEIKRLGKRFKKLVKCHRHRHRHRHRHPCSGPGRVRVALNRGVYVIA